MTDVCRVGDNVVDKKTIPIVFVPGVMGSRLHFTDIDQYWNPDSNWDMWHWLRVSYETCANEFHFDAPADVMTNKISGALQPNEIGRGWEGVSWEFYVPFLRFLNNVVFPSAETPVYARGYDWRQSNSLSGSILSEQIDEILELEEAEKVIICTHSMGGLVTRAALKSDSALAGKVAGVIHVVQPANGAPVAYRRFFTGVNKLDGGGALALILGNKDYKFTEIISGLPGPFQLLPFHTYRQFDANGDPQPWLTRTVNGEDEPIPGNVHDLYKSTNSPPGVFNPAIHDEDKRATVRTAIAARLSLTKRFHNWLDPYKHPNTYSIYGTGLESDVATNFDAKSVVDPVRLNEGDGTVPAGSGMYLFPDQISDIENIPDDLSVESPRQFSMNGIEHAVAYGDGQVQQAMQTLITRILFQAEDPDCEPKVPAPVETKLLPVPPAWLPSKGDVILMQEYLAGSRSGLVNTHYDLGNGGADGINGVYTQNALKSFQSDHGGLQCDGIYGPKSAAAFSQEINGQ
jgi:peptidoglycan hydrolase-like protein with peptidoglycan-binding domain